MHRQGAFRLCPLANTIPAKRPSEAGGLNPLTEAGYGRSRNRVPRAHAAVGLLVGTAIAAPPPPTISFAARGTVGTLDAENQGVQVERERGSADHVVAGITFSPGSSIGWHRHPGVVLVTVASGRLQVFHSDCERHVYKAGDSFYEEGDVHLARNRGKVDAVIYATWIIPTGTPTDGLTIPVDPPEGCPIR
jgi:quercetin dioxygenase-like cupin family protein